MGIFSPLLLMYILALAQRSNANIGYGLCSEVYQMHQYCTRASSEIASMPAVGGGRTGSRIGKQGPRGFPGSAGTVNYTAVDEEINKKFHKAERRINATFAKHEKILNKTRENIMEVITRMEETEARVEAKLLEYEMFINESLAAKSNEEVFPTDCRNVSRENAKSWDNYGGVFDIYPNSNRDSIEVYCDMTRDGGGWTVFQRRMDGSVNFRRDWNDYVNGFGSMDTEFWLGLEKIHQLTNDGEYELRLDFGDWEDNAAYAKYSLFSVAGASDNYRLTVSGYSGSAGTLLSSHNGMQFTAKNADHDTWSGGNCAQRYKGGWWFFGCLGSNLNGVYYEGGTYHSTHPDGIRWATWKPDKYSLKFTEMKFRRKN